MNEPVVTVTLNPAIDKTFSVQCLIPERKLDGKDVHTYPGGGGVNVARAVTRLGGAARCLWSSGGATGALLARLLEEEGISSQPISVAGDTRENLIAQDLSSRQHYRFGMPGPRFSEDDVRRWREAVATLAPPPEFLVLSGSLPPGASPEWFGELISSAPPGVRIVVDTKRRALARAVEQGVFLIKPNVHELAEITDIELRDEPSICQAARKLISVGSVQVVLVSMGRGGAILVTAEEAHTIPAPPVRLESKVGAGDSTVAGVVTALTRGASIREAARFGVAAGAAAVMSKGTELCDREETERLFQQLR